MAPHFDINVIAVGRDGFSEAEVQVMDKVIARGSASFASHGLPIGTVNRYQLSRAQAGALLVPSSDADCILLGERWAVPNTAMDVFMVQRVTIPKSVGSSPVHGTCSKGASRGRGTVISIQQGEVLASATFVHEIAHCLGLRHCEHDPSLCGPNNFMLTKTRTPRTSFTPAQVAIMSQHCFVQP